MANGIDYGRGLANVDTVTGKRYGVISVNTLHEFIWDELESVYPDPELDSEQFDTMHDDSEPIGFQLNNAEYTAHSAFDQTCLFITKSKYFTKCAYCSPCAPGAGNLNTPDADGVETLCFGHDMFDGGVAPYPVYNVTNGELVTAENA